MEPIEILAILILCGLAAAIVLLVMLLRRTAAAKDAVTAAELEAAITRATEVILREQRADTSTLRNDLQSELRGSRTETVNMVQTAMERLGQTLRESQRQAAELQAQRVGDLVAAQERQREAQDKQFADFRAENRREQQESRRLMEEKLTAMQTQNAEQLDKMRETVDEKLQKTLNDRISESFKMVNDRLAEVYKGLGEMQTLAGSVGDLKKVLSNVKTRGILGELQLGAIIEEMLAPEQYEVNVATRPNSPNRVEYAVRLPGEGEGTVYLPIDAKFPVDAYHHLLEAYDTGDGERVKEAGAVLERRIKDFAKDIRDKYVEPPYTTSFGIMFLPFEGLYAEVVRRGLVETLQNQYGVSVAGPTTLAALLNSLRMGFKTLAIQKRSGEVWEVLGAVKTEFGNFEKVLAKAKERIEQTGDELEKLIGTRTRAINRKLRTVAELPSPDAAVELIGE